jgi:hypothetical protein
VLAVLPYLHGCTWMPRMRWRPRRRARATSAWWCRSSRASATTPTSTRCAPIPGGPAFHRARAAGAAADLIILPGSKNTRGDLRWLREHGWDTAIARHLRYGGKLIGICGGFQMLGESVDDPHGVEGAPGSSAGLGLLPCAPN